MQPYVLKFRQAGHIGFCPQCGQPSLFVTIRVHPKARMPKPIVDATHPQEKWRKERIKPVTKGAKKTGAANLMFLKHELKSSVSRLENKSAASRPWPE